MPIASLIVDYCEEVEEYIYKIKEGYLDFECYLIPQKDRKALLIVVCPIFYIFEWAIFNPLFRWIMSKGLRRSGYKLSFISINRMELISIIVESIKNNRNV